MLFFPWSRKGLKEDSSLDQRPWRESQHKPTGGVFSTQTPSGNARRLKARLLFPGASFPLDRQVPEGRDPQHPSLGCFTGSRFPGEATAGLTLQDTVAPARSAPSTARCLQRLCGALLQLPKACM